MKQRLDDMKNWLQISEAMDYGSSFFDMDTIKSIQGMELEAAKKIALSKVQSSTARPANKAKAMAMIGKASNTDGLMQGMTNFMLSHPSEDLGSKRIE